MRWSSYAVLFFSIICMLFCVISAKTKFDETTLYFTAPLTGDDRLSKTYGNKVRIELQEEKEFPWVGYEIDTMIRARMGLQFYFSESLPQDVQQKLIQNNVNYLILPFISGAALKTDSAHLQVTPGLGVVSFQKVESQSYVDTTNLAVMLIDVRKNRIVQKNSEVVRQELCDDDDMGICLKDRVISITKRERIIELNPSAASNSTTIGKSIQLNQLGQALFITGSIMTAVGYGVEVTGNTSFANAAGLTLYAVGQTGLITTGLSTIPMNRSVRLVYGEDIKGAGKGWVYYGMSLAATTTGMILLGKGVDNNITPLVLTGAGVLLAGEILKIPSWVSFLKVRNRASRTLERLNKGRINN